MPVGPLRLQTISQRAVDTEAQKQGAPAFSKLRRALLQTSTMAANEDNPAKKREMLRAAMEGTGTGMSDVSLASHNQALNTVSQDTAIANQGLMTQFAADTTAERQATGIASSEKMQQAGIASSEALQQAGIASSEKMQGLSLAEARAAQAAGISASQALQDKQIAAAKETQATGIASNEKMQGLSLAEARAAQATGITAEQAMQEKQIGATAENQAGAQAAAEAAQNRAIGSEEKMQGLSLAEARDAQAAGITAQEAMDNKRLAAAKEAQATGIASSEGMQKTGIKSAAEQAQINRDYETQQTLQATKNQQNLVAFNAAMKQADTAYTTTAKAPQSLSSVVTPAQIAEQKWKRDYQDALARFYAQ